MPSTINYIEATLAAFPLPAAAHSVLRNSEFNDPFTGDSNTGWQSSGGYVWVNTGYVEAALGNDRYLYQEITSADPLQTGANYKVQVGISNFSGASGRLAIEMVNGYNSEPAGTSMTADGDHEFTFNAAGAVMRFHLRAYGDGLTTCRIEYCRVVRV